MPNNKRGKFNQTKNNRHKVNYGDGGDGSGGGSGVGGVGTYFYRLI